MIGAVSQLRRFSTVKVENPALRSYKMFPVQARPTLQQLDAIAPRFDLNGDQIEILTDPKVFYSTLKAKISQAKHRVFLSSLYIGKSQTDLMETISDALTREPSLKVDILVDCIRSTRDMPKHSSATLLAGLIKQFGNDRVNVRMYHTPHLNGWQAKVVPKRFNEIYGLQHMKIYGIDDEVMLSGANLSSDYFTNRQDRYWIFKDRYLTNYYHRVQTTIGNLSYKLISSNTKLGFYLDWPNSNYSSQPHMNVDSFIIDATKHLVPVLKSKVANEIPDEPLESPNTVVYPVSSFTPLLKPDQSTELLAINRVLALLDEKFAHFTMTAGYFNVFPSIWQRLTHARCSGDVIIASPESNSFYKSKGISKYLPDAYVHISSLFLKDVLVNEGQIPHKTAIMKVMDWTNKWYNNISNAFYAPSKETKKEEDKLIPHSNQLESNIDKPNRIKLLEWRKGTVNTPNGWSYHAKGIWINLPNDPLPSITVVGSSQYTQRAYGLDLESNAVVVTLDENLKAKMKEEVDNLKSNTRELGLRDYQKERKGDWWVRIVTNILTKFM